MMMSPKTAALKEALQTNWNAAHKTINEYVTSAVEDATENALAGQEREKLKFAMEFLIDMQNTFMTVREGIAELRILLGDELPF